MSNEARDDELTAEGRAILEALASGAARDLREEMSGGRGWWRVEGTIHGVSAPAIIGGESKRLERQGYVRPMSPTPDVVYFAITDAGRTAIGKG